MITCRHCQLFSAKREKPEKKKANGYPGYPRVIAQSPEAPRYSTYWPVPRVLLCWGPVCVPPVGTKNSLFVQPRPDLTHAVLCEDISDCDTSRGEICCPGTKVCEVPDAATPNACGECRGHINRGAFFFQVSQMFGRNHKKTQIDRRFTAGRARFHTK